MIIRCAQPEDAAGIAGVQVDSWRETYGGIVPDSYLNRMSTADRKQKWAKKTGSVIVAESRGEIVGFIHYGPERSGSWPGFDGELYALYIRRRHHRQGIGIQLFNAAVNELEQLGCRSAVCCVLAENESARLFYEAHGGKQIGDDTFFIDDVRMHEVIYGWDQLPRRQ
ncbi:GNAT family N-acetyltransferase [Bacillus daqingensis]|uniref:GNAT family N-acetyltransferase n=1 Tax=Bacillus daqingensis TaxID=872396 RepID=A0ABV9NVT1_9BACI